MLYTTVEHTTVRDALESYQAGLDEIPHGAITWLTHPAFFIAIGLVVLCVVFVFLTNRAFDQSKNHDALETIACAFGVLSFFAFIGSIGFAIDDHNDARASERDALHAELGEIVKANYEVEHVDPLDISISMNEDTAEIHRVSFEITSADNLNAAEVTMTQNDVLDMVIPVSKDNDVLAIRDGSPLDSAQQDTSTDTNSTVSE